MEIRNYIEAKMSGCDMNRASHSPKTHVPLRKG